MIDTMRGKAKNTTRTQSTTSRKSSGRVGLIVILGILLAAGLGAFILLGGDQRTGSGEPHQGEPVSAEGPQGRAIGGTGRMTGAPIQSGPTTTPARRSSTKAPLPDQAFGTGRAPDPDRFVGTGELRGTVQLLDASEPPAKWTLELVPSRFMVGSEHAIAHTKVYTASSLDFKLEQLPFGAYEVRALAPGFNGAWVTSVIDRTSTSPFVNLSLRAAGFLEGYLVDDHSLPLGELDVILVAQADGAHLETRSDALGKWRVEGVPDGVYELVVGPADAPLTKPERLQFRAPSMTFPPIMVKGLGSVMVTIVDIDDVPILDAVITGHSTGGGHVNATTDAFGVAHFGTLGPGSVRLKISHPLWKTRRGSVELEPNGEANLLLKMAAPR